MAGWKQNLQRALNDSVSDSRSVGGGCIADAKIVTLGSGRTIFVKTFAGKPDMFPKEADGLRAMAAANAIRVPEVLDVGDDYLALEHIESGSRSGDFMETFGRQFACMHKHHGDTFGFKDDNYCGSTVQKNTPTVSTDEGWTSFYWQHRLLFQYQLAERNGYADAEMTTLMNRLETRIDDLLAGSEEPPSILHGDLWSGNFMVGPEGEPVLIDPAAYYGHREADLGMTKLFGNFGHAFYAGYEGEYPLPPGHQDREDLYKLYHLFNHLNIFGMGYHGQCMSILRRYAH